MNEARKLYLGVYPRIDSIDHLIKKIRVKYRCWNYWHLPMIRTMYLAAVVASAMYPGVAEVGIYLTWKEEKIVEFWTFHYLLSNQMIKYNPTHHKYAGDSNMRLATHQNQSTRENSKKNKRGKIGRPSE